MRLRASINRTGQPAPDTLRAAAKPAIPAPMTRTGLVSGGVGSPDAQPAASPPPSTLAVAVKTPDAKSGTRMSCCTAVPKSALLSLAILRVSR
jgi:hypothetical protein